MGGVIKAERLRPAPNPAISKMDRWTQAPRGVEFELEELEIWLSSKYVSRPSLITDVSGLIYQNVTVCILKFPPASEYCCC